MLDLSTKHGHGISFVSGCKFYMRNSSSLWLFTRGQFKVVLLKMMSLPKKKRIARNTRLLVNLLGSLLHQWRCQNVDSQPHPVKKKRVYVYSVYTCTVFILKKHPFIAVELPLTKFFIDLGVHPQNKTPGSVSESPPRCNPGSARQAKGARAMMKTVGLFHHQQHQVGCIL